MHTDIRDHGASVEAPNNALAIQTAIDVTAAAGGGRVLVPPGTFRSGTIRLRSRIELHLAAGAVLAGTGRAADVPAWFPTTGVETRRAFERRLVLAYDCEDVAITGCGTIDGRHGCREEIAQGESQPVNLHLIACRRVTVRDVRLRDAGSWMQQILCCDEVLVEGVHIVNHGNRTNDGLDIDGSHDIRIANCDIDSHDDALVFKSTGPRACRNIVVSNCVLRSNCHGIKFGTESIGGFENVQVANCLVSPSRYPDPMPGFPAGRPPITGCALECTDGGTMRNIRLDGIIAEGVFAPIFIKLGNRHHTVAGYDDRDCTPGRIEHVQIRGLVARGAGRFTSSVTGYPGHPIRDLQITDCDLSYAGGCPADAILDAVPENSDGYPEMNMFQKKTGRELPAWGLFARHVDGLVLRDLRLRCETADAREPVRCEQVTGARYDGIAVDGEPYVIA